MLLLFSARSPCPLLRSSGPEPTRPWQLRAARVVAPHCGPLKGPSGAGRSSGSEYRARCSDRVCCSRNKSKHSTHTPARLQLLLVVFPPGIQVVDLKGEAILLIAMVKAKKGSGRGGRGGRGGGRKAPAPAPAPTHHPGTGATSFFTNSSRGNSVLNLSTSLLMKIM